MPSTPPVTHCAGYGVARPILETHRLCEGLPPAAVRKSELKHRALGFVRCHPDGSVVGFDGRAPSLFAPRTHPDSVPRAAPPLSSAPPQPGRRGATARQASLHRTDSRWSAPAAGVRCRPAAGAPSARPQLGSPGSHSPPRRRRRAGSAGRFPESRWPGTGSSYRDDHWPPRVRPRRELDSRRDAPVQRPACDRSRGQGRSGPRPAPARRGAPPALCRPKARAAPAAAWPIASSQAWAINCCASHALAGIHSPSPVCHSPRPRITARVRRRYTTRLTRSGGRPCRVPPWPVLACASTGTAHRSSAPRPPATGRSASAPSPASPSSAGSGRRAACP